MKLHYIQWDYNRINNHFYLGSDVDRRQLIQALKNKGCKNIKITKSSYAYPELVRTRSLNDFLNYINEVM